ncbi:MAG: hypothetical protein U0800_24295 [Isosphaeraceae bacterium]
MALLDGEARLYLLALAGRLGLEARRGDGNAGPIGSTRIQAEEMGEEDPNGNSPTAGQGRAPTGRIGSVAKSSRDRMRAEGDTAARRRNRGR